MLIDINKTSFFSKKKLCLYIILQPKNKFYALAVLAWYYFKGPLLLIGLNYDGLVQCVRSGAKQTLWMHSFFSVFRGSGMFEKLGMLLYSTSKKSWGCYVGFIYTDKAKKLWVLQHRVICTTNAPSSIAPACSLHTQRSRWWNVRKFARVLQILSYLVQYALMQSKQRPSD